MSEENKITKQAEFGKALFNAAIDSYQKEQQKEVIEALRQEFSLRDSAQQTIDEATFQLNYYNKVLSAIENGEFTITASYGPVKALRFNNRDLRLGHVQRDQLSDAVREKLEL